VIEDPPECAPGERQSQRPVDAIPRRALEGPAVAHPDRPRPDGREKQVLVTGLRPEELRSRLGPVGPL
jgi:hypothetical protein